jgi:hypothetical protein
MPQVVFDFTPQQLARLVAAELGLCPVPVQPGTQTRIIDPATGQPYTDQAWARRQIIVAWKRRVIKWERRTAVEAAIQTLDPDPDIAS